MFKSIRLFFLISTSFFLLNSCSHYALQGVVEKEDILYSVSYFSGIDSEYLFNARIDAFKNEVGGICVIKNLGENQHRVALLSDFGNTLLDFEFIGEKVIVHYVIEDLNKKIIVNKLKKYFQLLLNSEYKVKKSIKDAEIIVYQSKLQGKRIFIRLNEDLELQSIRQASAFKNKTKIDFYGTESHIDSMHFKSFELPIEMKFIRFE